MTNPFENIPNLDDQIEKIKNQEAEQKKQEEIELTEDKKEEMLKNIPNLDDQIEKIKNQEAQENAMAGLNRVANDANKAEKEAIKESNEQEAQENAMAGLDRITDDANKAEKEAIKESNEQEAQENAMAGLDRITDDANKAEKEAIENSEREELIKKMEGMSTLQRRAAAMKENLENKGTEPEEKIELTEDQIEKNKNQEAEQEKQEKINMESFEELKENIEKLSDKEAGLALILIINNLIIKLENGEKIDDKDILETVENFQKIEAEKEDQVQEEETGEQKTEAQKWFDGLDPEEQERIINEAEIAGKRVDYTPEDSDDPEINKVNKAIEGEWVKEELGKLRESLEKNEEEHESMSARISALEERLKILEEGVDPETQKTIDELKKTAEELEKQDPADLGKMLKNLFEGEGGGDNIPSSPEEIINQLEAGGEGEGAKNEMIEKLKKVGGELGMFLCYIIILFASTSLDMIKQALEKKKTEK